MRLNPQQRTVVFTRADELAATLPHAAHKQFPCGETAWMPPHPPGWRENEIAVTLQAHHHALMDVGFYFVQNKPDEFSHNYSEAVRSLLDVQRLIADYLKEVRALRQTDGAS